MKRWLVPSFCIALTASLSFADGDGPTRKMNASEATAFNALQSSIRAALPQAPPNYTAAFSGFDQREIAEGIKPGQMNWMFFRATYTLNDEVRESAQRSYVTDKIKGTPEQQAKRAALNAREEELTKARKSTRDSGEKTRIRAELNKIRAEGNALDEETGAQYQAWLRSGGAATADQNIDSALPPKELSIRILVNQEVVHINGIATPYKVQGAPLAFEQNDKCDDHGTCCITVLLGPFDRKKDGEAASYYLRNANLGVPTKARGMALIVSAPKDKPESARDLLRKTDLAKLKALLP